MRICDDELNKINYWISVNRDVTKSLYGSFLYICNEKYGLQLMDSKRLYFDLCIYFYYNLYDKYGITLFNSKKEKKDYYNEQPIRKLYYLDNDIDNEENQNENNEINNDNYKFDNDYNEYYESDSSGFKNDYNDYYEEENEKMYDAYFKDYDINDPALYHFIPKN